MWAIKFETGVPYFKGKGIHGHVYAGDCPSRAMQFLSREATALRLPIIGLAGNVLPATVVPVPRWAWNV